MTDKRTLEEEIRTMRKHFGGLVALVKDLKAKVEKFEHKGEPREDDEIKEIVEKQRHIDNAIAENAAAIRNIDNELKTFLKNVQKDANQEQVVDKDDVETEVTKNTDEVKRKDGRNIKRKCNFYNAGFCKLKHKNCRFLHPENICKAYTKNLKCVTNDCPDRHPRVGKWLTRRSG